MRSHAIAKLAPMRKTNFNVPISGGSSSCGALIGYVGGA